MKHITYLCLLTALLSACAGKQELSCLNAAEKITGRTSMWKSEPHGEIPIHDTAVERMKNLCIDMEKASQAKDKSQQMHLRSECYSELKALKTDAHNSQAVKNMKHICQEMTKKG